MLPTRCGEVAGNISENRSSIRCADQVSNQLSTPFHHGRWQLTPLLKRSNVFTISQLPEASMKVTTVAGSDDPVRTYETQRHVIRVEDCPNFM
jgi:hypothetical protein